MSEIRTEEECAQALKLIKILVKHKIIPIAAHDELYCKTWDAAFEIIDLLERTHTHTHSRVAKELFEGTNDALNKLNIKG